MEIKYLLVTDLDKANEISQNVKSFTELFKDFDTIDESPVEVPGFTGYFVTAVDNIELSDYDSYIDSIHPNRPDIQLFQDNLQENFNREEDGRLVVKELITMLRTGLSDQPDAVVSAIFKGLGWVRSLLKEGFFEIAYYELKVEIEPSGLLDAQSFAAIENRILGIVLKYDPTYVWTPPV